MPKNFVSSRPNLQVAQCRSISLLQEEQNISHCRVFSLYHRIWRVHRSGSNNNDVKKQLSFGASGVVELDLEKAKRGRVFENISGLLA